MIKAKKVAIAALACAMVLGAGGAVLSGCKKKPQDTIHNDIVNGGFEQGDLTGWKAAGDYAFDADGIVEEETVEGVNATVGGKVGKYYFNGLAATNATATGTLTSEPFKLGGVGKIGFKVGAGSDASKCYVEFIEHGTNTVLKKVSNEAYDAGFIDNDLVRMVVDLSEHIGKNIYIKVTDNGSTQNSHEYFHLDDFVMYKTEAEVTAANTERNDYIKMYGKPVFENDTPTAKTIKNGNFEDGLNNWQILEGDAYTPRSVSSSELKFWETREHNAEGDYFLNGFALSEERVGAIRSTTFTLGETGIISFLLGNAGVNSIYVAVCADEAIGDIAKDTELFKVYANEKFKDPVYTLNLLRRYIDASSYTPAATEETPEPEAVSLIGKKLYIKLVDNAGTGPFGAVNFDDVRCSMTEEEVLALEKSDYEWAMALTGRGAEEIQSTQDYYTNYDYPVALPIMRFTSKANSVAVKVGTEAIDLGGYIQNVTAAYGEVDASEITYKVTKVNYKGNDITTGLDAFVFDTAGLATVTYQAEYGEMALTETFTIEVTGINQIMNGGFETGTLEGWTLTDLDGNELPGASSWDIVQSVAGYWGGAAAYNKVGKYHFNGQEGGIPEDRTFKLTSSTFVLGGSGYISFKIGGHAAVVKVYDKTSNVVLAEYSNTEYADMEITHIELGARHATMVTYVADLSAYLGMELYLVLEDGLTGGWGHSIMDDVITYYETAPVIEGKSDTVTNLCEHGGTTEIAWVEAVNNITPELVQIVDAPQNIFVTGAQTSYNLENVIKAIEGAVIGQQEPVITKTIVKVSDGTNDDITSGFNSLNLAEGTYTVTYKFVWNNGTEDIENEKTLTLHVISANTIANGGFETGTLEGWTVVEGNAFANANVIGDSEYWGNRSYNQEGNYHLDGWKGADEPGTGIIRSSTFTLGGTGKISFRLGGCNRADEGYISVKKADGTEIARFTNTKQRAAAGDEDVVAEAYMWLYTFDLTSVAQLGDELYIEIVDKATGDWGLLFVDDIKTYHTEETFAALGTEDDDWFEADNELVATDDDSE